MAVALILKMHLVRSIKPTLRPHWVQELHDLWKWGAGEGCHTTECSLLLESYSLYLLLIYLAHRFLVLFIFPYETILPTF